MAIDVLGSYIEVSASERWDLSVAPGDHLVFQSVDHGRCALSLPRLRSTENLGRLLFPMANVVPNQPLQFLDLEKAALILS